MPSRTKLKRKIYALNREVEDLKRRPSGFGHSQVVVKALRGEASIQKSVITYARKKGCICIKLGGAGRFGSSGWPDYLILRDGLAIFIEFKKPGGRVTPLQAKKIEELCEAGFTATMCDEVESGKRIIDLELS